MEDPKNNTVIVVSDKALVKLAKTYRRRGFVAGFLFASVGPTVLEHVVNKLADNVEKLAGKTSRLKHVIDTSAKG